MTSNENPATITFNLSDLKRDKCPTCNQSGPYQLPDGTPEGLYTWSSNGTLTITPYASTNS